MAESLLIPSAFVPADSPTPDEVYAMPATPGQVRFWSLDRLNPGDPSLNMPLKWHCGGPLDLPILTAAFHSCVERHESLRTSFAVVAGELAQIIHPAGSPSTLLSLPVDDLTALAADAQRHGPAEAQRFEIDRQSRAHAAFRFNLAEGPLLAVHLLKLGPDSHLLLVTVHHIVCDGASTGVLLRDLLAFYQAALLGLPDPGLPELPIQFADYAVWSQQWRQSQEHAESLAFWRTTLGSGFQPIRLPRDLDAPEVLPPHLADATGEIQTLPIPPDLLARAQAFCIRAGITLNVHFFSTFCAMLARLAGDDLTIGSPCANRTDDTENLVGLLMNIQVHRLQLKPDSTFESILEQVSLRTRAASEHQMLAFEDILHDPFFAPGCGELGSGSLEIPIFFVYQKSFTSTERVRANAGTLTVTPLQAESAGAIFEIMFAILDGDGGARLELEYNPRFYKAGTIQNYLKLFVHLLNTVLTSPATPIVTLPLLSPSGRQDVITRWNRTDVDFGPFTSIPSLIVAQAASHPDRTAVECAGKSLTYRELLTQASSLADTLCADRVGPEERVRPEEIVAICTTRSLDTVVALLAVMFAGAAYLPLDPRHPPERLGAILADSGAQLVLTNFAANLPATVRQLRLDQPRPNPPRPTLPSEANPRENLLGLNANSLAYLLYTSGTTGVPKGVAIEHGALRNLLLATQRTPGLTADDTLLSVTTLAFDIATLELLLPLISGARLVLATEEQVLSPDRLLALLHSSRATVMQATPGAWRSLIDAGWIGTSGIDAGAPSKGGPPLKVLCGGEAMSRSLANLLLDRSPLVWNMYGPTETTIWSSATRLTRTAAAPRVGPPMANTQFYVLDPQLQPLPVGLEGELYIGGHGLARGYWRKPELTAASFLPNPFGPGRIYKTGDRARLHQDGTVHLLGRTDFQVKVRGYRIELGEIEAALLRSPRVREAAVLHQQLPDMPAAPATPDRPEKQGEPERSDVNRLIAYVAVGDEASPDSAPALIAELEANLRRTLPDYMMPSAILALATLPRNSNGKLDRKALPQPSTDVGLADDGAAGQSAIGPRDILERQLTELWQTTLGIDHIDLFASFFSLGAGSLAALRLITRINRIFAMDLGLASLVSASSIASVAELIRNRFSVNTASTLIPLKPNGSRPPLFILHGVGGNIINFYALASRIDPDQPVYAIQAQSLLAGQPALLRLEDMAAHYLSEIRALQPHGPYHFLGYSFGGTLVLEMAHQLRTQGEQVALLGMLDARSKVYEQRHRAELSVQDRIDRSIKRVRGNTHRLPPAQRLIYLLSKLKTRALRLSSAFAAWANVRYLPAALKSAYDINHVALIRYQVRSFAGHMVLFRAAEQEFTGGAQDLGWSDTFTHGVEVHDIPGDHERIFLEPGIDHLAKAIRQALDACPPSKPMSKLI